MVKKPTSYSESDIESAIDSGILDAETAQALREHIAASRTEASTEASSEANTKANSESDRAASPTAPTAPASPTAPHGFGGGADEENIRLIASFNDIFVSIAIIIMLLAVAWLTNDIFEDSSPFADIWTSGLAVAAVAWGLAEYFTRIRRMALPSILLAIAFISALFSSFVTLLGDVLFDVSGDVPISAAALLAAGANYLYWKRFTVPISIALGTVAVVVAILTLINTAVEISSNGFLTLLFISGLCGLAFALWWDHQDLQRQTFRSDTAFWLHIASAPMIAHPIFEWMGVDMFRTGGHLYFGFGGVTAEFSEVTTALIVISLYIIFGIIALIIDRRALLVSALGYVLFALATLLEAVALEFSFALTALIISAALLLFSALWQSARALVVGMLPSHIAAHVPAVTPSVPRK